MIDLRTLQRALGGEISAGQLQCPGPGHSAADRSLSIKIDDNAPDEFLVHSFAGDDPIACKDYVRQKLGLPAFKPNGGNGHHRASDDDIARALMAAVQGQRVEQPKGRVVATYNYTDDDGTLLYQVLRLEPKSFRQRRPDGNGGWIWKLEDVRRVLYRRQDLLKYPDATVFVTEGEKDADRLASLDLVATTVAHGKWTNECVQLLAGRHILILEDNDKAGRAKAREVAALLHGIANTIRTVRLPGLAEGGDVSDWLDGDPRRAEKLVGICFETPEWTAGDDNAETQTDQEDRTDATKPEGPPVFWHGEADYRESRPYLVQGIIPETGCGLIAGQWGTYKTFVADDLAHCIMSGEPFLSFPIMRRGGVLFVALEGNDEVAIRLQGVIDDRGKITSQAPFAWIETCPPLLGKNAADQICKIATPIVQRLKEKFDLPLALIVIDTLIAAAGYSKDGQENDAAIGQAIMNTLAEVAKRLHCFAFGIDHFGKAVETGTRGTLAKEGRADVLIALLGDKSVSGQVTNTRLALRKRRGGRNGEEFPFQPRVVDMGVDHYGQPMSTLVIDWQTQQTAPRIDARWTPSMQLLRRVLMTTLADSGKTFDRSRITS